MIKKLMLLAVIMLYSISVYAMDVTLQWDANTEPDLAGYKIYYDVDSGAPYDGSGAAEGNSPIDIILFQDENPDPNIVQFTLHGLSDSGVSFLAVTAYDNFGRESGYSNEVSTSLAPAPPTNLLITAIDQLIGALQDIKQYLARQ